MQTLLSRLRGWRHGRGFGIHSPFAFRFITEVLRQKLGYYGYADISPDKRMRLLYRLVVFFQPERVMVMSAAPKLPEQVVRRASRRATIVSQRPDFIIIDADDTPESQYLPLLTQGVNALILNASRAQARSLATQLPHGMLFDNRRGTFAVAGLSYLPRQNFDVKF